MAKTRSNRKSSHVKVTVVVKNEADADADINEELDPDFDISDSEVKQEVSTSESESEDNDGDETEVRLLEEQFKKSQGNNKEVDLARTRREKQRDYERNCRGRATDPLKLQKYRERKRKNRMESRRKMREENPEKYEACKRKDKEAKRRMREQLKKEDPEKFEALKKRNSESAKRRRNAREALKRKGKILQEEDPRNSNECEIKDAEADRMRLTIVNEARNMRCLERAAELKKQNRAKMTPEEKRERDRVAKRRMREELKNEDPEKFEALKKKNRESAKRRYAREALKRKGEMLQEKDLENSNECEIKDAEVERMRLTIINEARNMRRLARAAELKKQNRAKMTPEEKRERDRKYKEKRKKLLAELPKEKQEERREEIRSKMKFYNLLRGMKMTEEEKEAVRVRQRNYLKNLTGEKLERYKQSRAKAARKRQERLKNDPSMKKNQILEKLREYAINYCRKKVANEAPEERQKRLRRYKINAARRKLRKELEEIGVPPEEIERRSKLMKEEMEKEPLPPLRSEYRPRLQGRKPHRVSSQKSITRSSSRSSSNVTSNPGESSIQEVDPHFDDHMFDNDNSSLPSPSPCNMFDVDDTSQSFAGVRDEVDLEQSFEALLPEPTPVNHVCKECNGSFISENDVRTHFKLVHVQKCWKCPKCSELCISPADFAEHYKSHSHGSSNQKLVKQRESENQKTTATTDNTEAKSPGSRSSNAKHCFSCLKCQENCKSLNALSEHVRKFHPESFWQCPTCKLLKYHESSLLYHLKFCNDQRVKR